MERVESLSDELWVYLSLPPREDKLCPPGFVMRYLGARDYLLRGEIGFQIDVRGNLAKLLDLPEGLHGVTAVAKGLKKHVSYENGTIDPFFDETGAFFQEIGTLRKYGKIVCSDVKEEWNALGFLKV
uniref:Uncharacterized protein n=1 Tax=viral metagenome TaxID=1070528 RepID=A0A6C0CG39_9ZZZZ